MEEHLSHGIHKHVLEDGTVVEHSHEHVHTHTHQNTKAVLNRLSRAIGHLESISGCFSRKVSPFSNAIALSTR